MSTNSVVVVRVEEEADFRATEELTRESFWNLHVEGADEHFLLSKLRQSQCFIPPLSLVATIDNEIVAHISYSRSEVCSENGSKTGTITFGPVSVSPKHQGRGVGALLIRKSLARAAELGYQAVIILGYPCYYNRFGFKNCFEFNISYSDGTFPKALMALELVVGSLQGVRGRFCENPVFQIDCGSAEFAEYDSTFPVAEKYATVSQRVFSEMVRLKHQDPEPADLVQRCHCRDRLEKA